MAEVDIVINGKYNAAAAFARADAAVDSIANKVKSTPLELTANTKPAEASI